MTSPNAEKRVIIETADGFLIEVFLPPSKSQKVSFDDAVLKVDGMLQDSLKSVLSIAQICGKYWSEISENVRVGQAELELGFAFEAEGKAFITAARANASIVVKVTLSPQKHDVASPD